MRPSVLFCLKGKQALVTGGATGIGFMAAEGLIAAGAKVFVVSRNGQACEKAAARLNTRGYEGSAEGFAGDVSSEETIEDLVEALKDRCDRLDILINNAGCAWGQDLQSFPFAQWQRVMNLNVAGLFTLTQKCIPLLAKAGMASDPARVLNLGSVMGEIPMGDGAYSYAASKAAVHHLTKILAKELVGQHINVNAIAPGPFVSKMTAFATSTKAGQAKVARSIPMGRLGTAEDIGGVVQFLSGRAGAYVTGAVVPLSGGVQLMTGPALFDGPET